MIPDHIYISGIKVDIVIDGDMESRGDTGLYIPQKTRIELSAGMSDEKARITLIHEIIEAINTIYDVGLKHHQINLLEAGIASTELLK
jgi:hypothetical protein